jgi:pilus assembly protein CpaE
MSDRYRVLVAVDPDVDRGEIERLVALEPGLEMAGVIDDDRSWAERRSVSHEALLIACVTASREALELIEESVREHPQMPVIMVCTGQPNGVVRQVFEAGADDIVVVTDPEAGARDVYFAVQKALTKRAKPTSGSTSGGDVICVLGPKGGTGKTLTSSSLAVALAEEGKSVALVDLDLQFGDLGLVLSISPERSLYDLATAGGTMDADKLDAYLAHHPTGVRVLLAPVRPDQAMAITPAFLHELFPLLREVFDVTVVDTPPGFTPEVIAAVDAASSICLVGTLDAPSLKNAKLGAETLELMGYPRDQIRIILNRADSSVGVTHADVVSVLGRAPDVLVPSHRDVVRSINAGESIMTAHPRSEAAKAFRALAQLVIADRAQRDRRQGERRGQPRTKPASERGRRGLLGLGGRN